MQFSILETTLPASLLCLLLCSQACSSSSATQDLKNLTFKSSWTSAGQAPLRNGEYREPAAPKAASEIVVKLGDNSVFGEVAGQQIGAAILVTDPGGSGTFFDLALLIKHGENWFNTDLVQLGDRVRIKAMRIDADRISVDLLGHGPDDRMCCPSLNMTRNYIIAGEKLVNLNEHASAVASTISAVVWKWQRSIYNNDGKSVPADAGQYTLLLAADGTVNIRADCNRGGGTFKLTGSKITIDITRTTRAACPPDSLQQVFIRDLNSAAIFFLKDGALYLDLKYDTGTMKFLPSDAVD